MSRGTAGQEVSCLVALPTLLYPSLLHRRAGATGGGAVAPSSAAPGSISASAAAGGSAHGVPHEVAVHGALLEVRLLWQPPPSDKSNTAGTTPSPCPSPPPQSTPSPSPPPPPQRAARSSRTVSPQAHPAAPRLYAFVRVKDADHRMSGWFPLHDVYVKRSVAQSSFGDLASAAAESTAGAPLPLPHGVADDMVRLSHLLHAPWLSHVYAEVTPGMARTQRARRQLDYLEERLLRDCRTPTTVRYFVYLDTYVFAPWYYAPFGLLHSAYDPMLPCTSDADAVAAEGVRAAVPLGARPPPPPQPYIRDAFLCPFSLRIFKTCEQLHYETRAYRAGRLRPPGEEIYSDAQRGLSVFKINGSQHVTYCRHLFLVGKSFLENKLAGHDVHSYYFYVVCLHHRYFPDYVADTSAMYFAGFFTWEKHVSEYNLACIATLPCFGRRASRPGPAAHGGADTAAAAAGPPQVLRHLGQFMIALSYELAYGRNQVGTPEKPLSDLGAVAYQTYWRRALVRWMKPRLNALRWAAAVDVDGAPEAGGESAAPGDAVVVVALYGGEDGAMNGSSPASSRKRARGSDEGVGEESHAEADAAATAPLSRTRGGVAAPSSPRRGSAAPGSTAATQQTTIKEIAAAVRLEEADVLTTLLGMGVLHRSSEDRSTQLLLPQRYVDWMYDELLRWEGSSAHAVFQPALLRSRGAR